LLIRCTFNDIIMFSFRITVNIVSASSTALQFWSAITHEGYITETALCCRNCYRAKGEHKRNARFIYFVYTQTG
jgi:hypothetical protein